MGYYTIPGRDIVKISITIFVEDIGSKLCSPKQTTMAQWYWGQEFGHRNCVAW